MRKILFTFSICSIFLMAGCGPKAPKQKEVVKLPIESLVENFMSEHSNYLNNNVTMEEGDKAFYKIFMDTTKNYLEGVPVKLRTINKNGKTYMAQFQCWTSPNNFDFNPPVYCINGDILTAIPDSLVSKLKENTYYTLEGCPIESMANLAVMETLLGKRTYAVTPVFGIRKNDIYDDRFEINLGLLYYHFDGIKEFVEKKDF